MRLFAERFEDARHLRLGVLGRYEEAARLRRLVAQRYEQGGQVVATVRSLLDIAAPLALFWRSGYEEAGPPRAGVTAAPKPPRPEPCYVPQLPVPLVFEAAADRGLPVHLVFVCDRRGAPGPDPEPGKTIVIPVRRTYVVINEITLHRVDTGAALRAHSFSMSLDYQSWTWTWSASLHQDAAAHLGRDGQGDPPELEVRINGLAIRLRLERIVKDQRFMPQVRWSVSGKGKASILGAPYAPAMSFGASTPRTAQQLAADVLKINGVGIGWTVDWGIVDWMVPGGAWAMQGTFIDAINDIATAAGGYVQPHPTDPVLRILPRYPAAPWAWGRITPDIEIPGAVAEFLGTEYVDRPGYNRVFVGGVGAGVFGPFSRAGSGGKVLAPQVSHALITHVDVHRARGIAEISNTGRQEHVTLRMQVLPEAGVIMPGKFVRHVGDKTVMGIVRSTSIDWSRPTLRQTLGIETHAA